ncbi:MAG: hypothetical protein OXG35_33910 [Acidobacteria bacterium]|nr:hypothetical protein [Acidobacteriota bacterium]
MTNRTINAERRLRKEMTLGAREAVPIGTPDTDIAQLAHDWYAGPTHAEAGNRTPMETWLRERRARNRGSALEKARQPCC